MNIDINAMIQSGKSREAIMDKVDEALKVRDYQAKLDRDRKIRMAMRAETMIVDGHKLFAEATGTEFSAKDEAILRALMGSTRNRLLDGDNRKSVKDERESSSSERILKNWISNL